MDPSDFFDIAPLRMHCENLCSFYPPSSQEPPSHPLIQYHRSALPVPTQTNHAHVLEQQSLSVQVRSKPEQTKRIDDFQWSLNVPCEENCPSESQRQSGNTVRKGRKDRDELKEQVGELKERLLTLQEKVRRAFGQRQWSQNKRRRESEEYIFASLPKKHKGNQVPRDSLFETEGRTWQLDCTELSRRHWDGDRSLAEDRQQTFAQLLKVELGNAIASVIDKVLRIYTKKSEAQLFSPPPHSVCFVDSENEKWGIVTDRPKRVLEVDCKERDTALKQSSKPIDPTLVQTNLHSLHLSEPSLLPPHHIAKHPSRLAPPPFPPLHLLQSVDPLPFVHYSVHQLFSRALSNVPVAPIKNFHVTVESVFPPPMPQLGPPGPSLCAPPMNRPSGRRERGAGGAMDHYLSSSASEEGLSPCHLKKAKLMFFYTRYPSSGTLKTYFPDVKFSRCVTSQMIKWFSNFREFFYIQMERFARQAVHQALMPDMAHVSRDRRLRVGPDTELYRILNMHYNKSNVYQVPDGFIQVSEVALREFYSAIWSGRDSDPCWKKAIYKVVCKLDSHVPETFRRPGCPVG